MAHGPITSWQIEGENVKAVTVFPSLCFKITANGDCSHEIRKHLFLGRKAMTNLDSVLKSRDITLLTKVHVVKVMIFPVVTYDWESWTIMKVERAKELMPSNCVSGHWRVPWTARSDQSILREINSEYFLEGLMLKLKLQYFGHLMWTADSLEKSLMLGKIEGRRRREHHRIRWLDCITDAIDMNLGKLREMVRDREAWCVSVSPWGPKVSDTIGWLNNNMETLEPP